MKVAIQAMSLSNPN